MLLGCFGRADQMDLVRRAGFGAMELDIMELSRMDGPAFDSFAKACAASGLRFEAFSGFMPLTERIHDAGFDMPRWLEHAKAMGGRTARLGARVWPMGAGKCRSIPEGADPQAAGQKVVEFFGGICDAVREYGITVAIEPLGPANSNHIRRIAEAADTARRIGAKNCRAMCDLRHMASVGEPLGEISRHAEWIAHAHVDYPFGALRLFPRDGDGFDYGPYVAVLLGAGIPSLAVEATAWGDFLEDASASAALLRRLLAEGEAARTQAEQ
ncbi:MAG TPA: sugar phosphate isomerase/epimerase [Candidatus Limnocylindria bacterium]|nr:sugar phosphate isomerase/epimerase [Candidatus Limnocylindria bacterium]